MYSYDEEGNRIREEVQDVTPGPIASTRFTNFGYDAFNRLKYTYFSATAPEGSGSVFVKRTYFADGTLHTERDPEGHTTTYAYDYLKRLISVVQTVGSEDLTTEYEYDRGPVIPGNNHLVSSSDGVSSVSYVYDDNGSTTNVGTRTYEYSEADRLRTVDQGATATYTYDGDGRRVQKITTEGTTYYFYDPAGRLLTEMMPAKSNGLGDGKDYVYLNGNPIARVDWSVVDNYEACPPGLGTGEEECDPQVANAELFFYHTDHLGTPVAMTAGDASVVWRAEHLPFGEAIIDPSATISNNLRLPGQYFDSETGLHQNWFRDYDPKTGRYREADPAGFLGGTNPFAYVSGNPVLLTDPSGLCSVGSNPASPLPPCATDSKGRWKLGFIRLHAGDAQTIASMMGTDSAFVLAQSALESQWGHGDVALNGGNFFGLKSGKRLGGTIGAYRFKGDDYGVYDDPGYLNSGMSMANSVFGRRVFGATTMSAYAAGLTVGPGAFNPTSSYPGRLDELLRDIQYWLPCLGLTP